MIEYNPQHRDEMDLLREAVFAKFRQERGWHAEAGQIEIAIAENERDLQRSLPKAAHTAHLANGFAHSESMVKLYLRYDGQLHRHFKSCIQQLNDLQDRRRSLPNPPWDPDAHTNRERERGGPVLPISVLETATNPGRDVCSAAFPDATTEPAAAQPASPDEPNQPPAISEDAGLKNPAREQGDPTSASTSGVLPNEPNLTPEQARLAYMKAEIKRFEDYQARILANQRRS